MIKINTVDIKPVTASPAPDRKAALAVNATQASASPQASTQVALSPAAAVLTQAVQGASFDHAKVERVAKAIAEGTYKVNPQAIADKLIAHTAEVLNHKRGT